ncbi:carbonate dehydratase [Plectosphaerella plurivora]|uniref:carbonic anhydrase n=1 Tax=Plectosphaerella plurivora TaxID=936078 RepID=A0A9P9ABX8_9PEZI|nr:carbonate dehydratase [Plectosphaerella plurivora]
MRSIFALSAFTSLVSAFCDHGTTLNPRQNDIGQTLELAFSGIGGPLEWGHLNESYRICATGTSQSPINIRSHNMTTIAGSHLGFDLPNMPEGAEFENLGKTVEVNTTGTLTRDGKAFKLAQFHFHTPGEHQIDSHYYPLEVHFVFQAEDKEIAVVGFLMEPGTEEEGSKLFKNVFQNLAQIPTRGLKTVTAALDFTELRDHLHRSHVFQYTGSLTVPPCSQNLLWHVVQEPLFIDLTSFRAVRKTMGFNARYIQNPPGEVNLLQHACRLLREDDEAEARRLAPAA